MWEIRPAIGIAKGALAPKEFDCLYFIMISLKSYRERGGWWLLLSYKGPGFVLWEALWPDEQSVSPGTFSTSRCFLVETVAPGYLRAMWHIARPHSKPRGSGVTTWLKPHQPGQTTPGEKPSKTNAAGFTWATETNHEAWGETWQALRALKRQLPKPSAKHTNLRGRQISRGRPLPPRPFFPDVTVQQDLFIKVNK